jgi:tRNA threonylcarbamoyl adenosine modification protein YeaZ
MNAAANSETQGPQSNGRRPWLLAIDTATSRVVVAAGALDGDPLGATTWIAGRSHGEQLLPAIGRLHGEANLRRSRIKAVIVGTGPGAFTGLRVGIATAKALAHELAVSLVGVSTADALLEASAAAGLTGDVLLLPAGPHDDLVIRKGETPRLVAGPVDVGLAADGRTIAVDLDGRVDPAALERGETARTGLAASLLRMGAGRLERGQLDDLAAIVPDYVSLPRGVAAETGEVTWSRDPR